ncbi:suppressor of fused homolog [Anastrepha obliqua]|uniref:suppressor of fused homolog n=1 Tax=Anastrepha obliqua TaxID=95512 RepID=UPI0024096658|nr:suppressor of fused homolog [Anastrepha obliqua]
MADAPSTSQSSRMEPPPGLKALIDHCQSIYPDQANPLQVTTVLKYWLGGQDPLDYISMYSNSGDPERGIPPHWHYVSFGLSDLHGDGRVHVQESNEMNTRSGMGFELSFRLLKNETEKENSSGKPQLPPTWPANLLQSIARYCFETGNMLCFGDNIPWRKSLDGNTNSQLKNILIAEDPQLSCIQTVFGTVEFCQIVGVTDEELEQASRWNGRGVLNFLQQDIKTGGNWWITDMSRSQSVFELFPELLLNLQDDLEKQGSDLAGVNADFTFREIQKRQCIKTEIDSNKLNEQCVFEENNLLEKLQIKREDAGFPQSMSMSSVSLHKSCPLSYQPHSADSISMDGIEITLAPYAAKYLMLAIKDRIRHGRHFTFKAQHLALTLVAESVTGAIVSKASPFGIIGYWIQVLIPDELVSPMMESFKNLQLDDVTESTKRHELEWPNWKLKLIIDNPSRGLELPMGL